MLAPSKKREAAMVVDIRPIKIGDEHYVAVVIDDHENRHGPYFSAESCGHGETIAPVWSRADKLRRQGWVMWSI
jgi:hypothetical protein